MSEPLKGWPKCPKCGAWFNGGLEFRDDPNDTSLYREMFLTCQRCHFRAERGCWPFESPAAPPSPPAEDPAPGAAAGEKPDYHDAKCWEAEYAGMAQVARVAVKQTVELRAEVARLREALAANEVREAALRLVLAEYAEPANWLGEAGVTYNGPGTSHSGWFRAEAALRPAEGENK